MALQNIAQPIIVLFLLTLPGALPAQVKYEREYRIPADEVPVGALDLLQKCPFEKKIKWYREESEAGITLEAKTRYEGHWYSLEFDRSGALQDVEKTFDYSNLQAPLRDTICQRLHARFQRFRIQKSQLQWIGSPEEWLKILTGPGLNLETFSRIELEVEVREPDGNRLFEVLHDREGRILRSRPIITRTTDNMDF